MSRILHRPTFLRALVAQPGSPEFPALGILHSICSLASLYAPIEALLNQAGRAGESIELEDGMAQRVREVFGERHAKLAAKHQDEGDLNGGRLLEVVQCWFGFSLFVLFACD